MILSKNHENGVNRDREESQGAARQLLRGLCYSLRKHLADPDADLQTLAEQARQTAELALAELRERKTA